LNKTDKLSRLYGVVLCQDSTLALWPLSTLSKPFEFEPLPGSTESLFDQAIARLKPYVSKIIFAASSENAGRIKSYIAQNGLLAADEYSIMVETYRRGSALTLALAAAQLRSQDQQAIMLVVPLLLSVSEDERWRAAVQRIYRVAATDQFALVGTEHSPNMSPSNTSGIIKPGTELPDTVGAQKVRAFIDSPPPATLYRAYEQGALDYTGIFAARATLILNALKQPALASYDENARSIQRIAETARFFATLGTEHWATKEAKALVTTLPDISLEQAVFGEPTKLICIPTNAEVTKLATLAQLAASKDSDRANNVAIGGAHLVDSQNTAAIVSTDKTVVALGVSDLIIVETDDAVLVVSKESLNQLPTVARTVGHL
jgi:mannose-1-phosphate guanylyltransferase